MQQIAGFAGNTPTAPVDDTNGGDGYDWDGYVSGGFIYIQVTPNTGTNNNYSVGVYFRAPLPAQTA